MTLAELSVKICISVSESECRLDAAVLVARIMKEKSTMARWMGRPLNIHKYVVVEVSSYLKGDVPRSDLNLPYISLIYTLKSWNPSSELQSHLCPINYFLFDFFESFNRHDGFSIFQPVIENLYY